MSFHRFRSAFPLRSGVRVATAAMLATAVAAAATEIVARAQAPAPVSLPYANSYLTTGNYVTGTVDLPGTGTVNGFSNGTIHMSRVPTNDDGSPAEILGAWLYWETIVTDPSQIAGAKFRGLALDVVKASSLALTGPFASCWGAN